MKALLILGAACILTGCAHPYRKGSSSLEERYYTNRSDGLILVRIRTEAEGGGGTFLLFDAGANITAVHTNQTQMGGGSYLSTGNLDLKVDPQTSEILKNAGAVFGAAAGEAIKAAMGVP